MPGCLWRGAGGASQRVRVVGKPAPHVTLSVSPPESCYTVSVTTRITLHCQCHHQNRVTLSVSPPASRYTVSVTTRIILHCQCHHHDCIPMSSTVRYLLLHHLQKVNCSKQSSVLSVCMCKRQCLWQSSVLSLCKRLCLWLVSCLSGHVLSLWKWICLWQSCTVSVCERLCLWQSCAVSVCKRLCLWQVTQQRVLAFIKRLTTMGLHQLPQASAAYLATARCMVSVSPFFLHFPPCKVHSLPPFVPGVVLDSPLFTVSALIRTSHFLLLYTILAFQETELYDLWKKEFRTSNDLGERKKCLNPVPVSESARFLVAVRWGWGGKG